jgi:hypothetical protein
MDSVTERKRETNIKINRGVKEAMGGSTDRQTNRRIDRRKTN